MVPGTFNNCSIGTDDVHGTCDDCVNASSEGCDDHDSQDNDAVEDSSRLDSKSSSGNWANNDTN